MTGIEVEPALPALLFRAAVPGDPERLQAPAGKRDQVLLQRINAESVGDLVIVQPAIGTLSTHHKFVTLAEEGGRNPEMLDLGASKIAEHRRGGRVLHGQRVVRHFPGVEFRSVAASTGLGADESRWLLGTRGHATHQRQYCQGGWNNPPQGAHALTRCLSRAISRRDALLVEGKQPPPIVLHADDRSAAFFGLGVQRLRRCQP